MSDLEDARAFADSLGSPVKPSAPPPAPAPVVGPPVTPPTGPEIDAGAAHLAATLTELRISTQRLHADLTQRLRAVEAKVDTGLPEWRLLSQAVVRAGEEAGRKATADLVASNQTLMAAGRALNERRKQDLAYLWGLAKWVALPLAVVGLGAIAWGVYDAGKLPPRWMLLVAYVLGLGTMVLGVQIVEWVDGWLRQRTWWPWR